MFRGKHNELYLILKHLTRQRYLQNIQNKNNDKSNSVEHFGKG